MLPAESMVIPSIVSFFGSNFSTATMKLSYGSLLVVLVAIILVADGVAAIAGPCSSSLNSLSVCLPAVEGENPPSPTDACCAVVRSTDTSCLCTIVTAYSNSMGVNMHASLLLPKECKKIVPAGHSCDGTMHSHSLLIFRELLIIC